MKEQNNTQLSQEVTQTAAAYEQPTTTEGADAAQTPAGVARMIECCDCE